MNKELNLVEILKDCPQGTKLWTDCCGEVEFVEINKKPSRPIFEIKFKCRDFNISTDRQGRIHEDGIPMLFPSKDNRDWSTFKAEKPKWNPDTLQPFDKVLVRDSDSEYWDGDLYLYTDKETGSEYPYYCLVDNYKICIPFNDETKHLLGTNQEPPEFYQI